MRIKISDTDFNRWLLICMRCREMIDISSIWRHARLYYLTRKSLNRTPPFIDSEMRVLLEIGNHKRRKEFFIRRTCRAQLCFARFVGGNALLESCHAMETLLKTSFNICPPSNIYIYISQEYIERMWNSCDNFVYFPSLTSEVSRKLNKGQRTLILDALVL